MRSGELGDTQIVRPKAWIIVPLLIIPTSILCGLFPWMVFGVLGAILLMLIMQFRPGWVLVLFLAYIWLLAGRSDPGDLLENYPMVRWGSYLLIPPLCCLTVIKTLARGRWQMGMIEPFILFLSGVILISGLVNRVEIKPMVETTAIYLRYPVLFLLIVNLDLKEKGFATGLKFLFMITGLLCIEALTNFLLWEKRGDEIFFTLGMSYGTANGGLFLGYSFCFLVAYLLEAKAKLYLFVAAIFLFLTAWVAEIRAMAVIVPVASVLIYSVHKLMHKDWFKNGFLLLSIFLIGLVVAGVFVPWHDVAFRIQGLMSFNPGYRFDVSRRVLDELVFSDRLFLGWGPRSFNPGTLGGAGRMFELMVSEYGTRYFPTPNQLVTSFSEVGLVGFSAYWIMLVTILYVNLDFLRSVAGASNHGGNGTERNWTIVSLAFIGIWFHYAIFGLWYYDLWRMDMSSFVFWTCAAAIYGERKRRTSTLEMTMVEENRSEMGSDENLDG